MKQSSWKTNIDKNFSCKKPILIEGLPGIGNVGKLVVDYMIDILKAKKVGSFFSFDMPNSVFVTHDGSVQLPSIELYHVNRNNQDFLLLAGDAQPSAQRASYEFTSNLLDLVKGYGCKQVIALGGIGLPEEPTNPQVYIAGNNKKFIKQFNKFGVNSEVFGVVGPIVGVSGLLLGLAGSHKIQAVSLLGETFGHPMYIGLNESRLMLEILDKKYGLDVDFSELNEEIALVEEELAKEGLGPDVAAKNSRLGKFIKKDTNYIG